MGLEILLIPLGFLGGIGLVALLIPVVLARGRSWWTLPLLGGIGYAALYTAMHANSGWSWQSFFATLGVVYFVTAFLLFMGALLLLPFQPTIAAHFRRNKPASDTSTEQ